MWYKFHRSRTISINVIQQNGFYLFIYFENLPRDITPRVIDTLPLFRYIRYINSLSMFIQTFKFLAFVGSEKSVTKIFKNGKIWKPPWVKGPWPPFYHYTFLTLETKCGMFHRSRTINIKVIEQNAFYFFENLPKDIPPRVMDPWPLLRYTRYIRSMSMFIRTFNFLAFIVPEKSDTKIFKNGKIWKPIKGHDSKSYEPLATILPLHLPYLRDQVWYKVHWSRTITIKSNYAKCILKFETY